MSREGFERGVSILHFLGGSSIDVAGDRAIAQTKMTISQRAPVEACCATSSAPAASTISSRSATGAGASCCASRSTRRTASTRSIPRRALTLDPKLLAQFPEGYRHLAYLQTRIGYNVKPDMPGLDGPEVEALYRRGEAWLKGGSIG